MTILNLLLLKLHDKKEKTQMPREEQDERHLHLLGSVTLLKPVD